MRKLTQAGRRVVEAAAERHDVGTEAATTVLDALVSGSGTQAQFSHPDLGGMGQWSKGGMTMVGDMFNRALKSKVDALCTELAEHAGDRNLFEEADGNHPGEVSYSTSQNAKGDWPAEFGAPSSTGSQNDLHYAVFPGTKRLAIRQDGKTSVYDTGSHEITGFSQQQSTHQTLTFTSQQGLVKLDDLKRVD